MDSKRWDCYNMTMCVAAMKEGREEGGKEGRKEGRIHQLIHQPVTQSANAGRQAGRYVQARRMAGLGLSVDLRKRRRTALRNTLSFSSRELHSKPNPVPAMTSRVKDPNVLMRQTNRETVLDQYITVRFLNNVA